ncbi:MAG: type II secretion system protein [Planctomycetes bacterium]|nr:type II secretion system protein [Planctomycetota bacterium]
MNNRRNAFTLVELVVVIMILGILAAVAAPKLLNTTKTATDNGLRQTLSIVRDAIELYAAENGGDLPPCADATTSLQDALKPFIRGTFPKCPVGTNDQNVTASTTDPLVADAIPVNSWKYNTSTGEFIVNSAVLSGDGVTAYEAF